MVHEVSDLSGVLLWGDTHRYEDDGYPGQLGQASRGGEFRRPLVHGQVAENKEGLSEQISNPSAQ